MQQWPTYLKPDLCIIGGGSAGLTAAAAARAFGASVVLVEKGRDGRGLPEYRLRAVQVADRRRPPCRCRTAGRGVRRRFRRARASTSRRLHDHIAEVIAGSRPMTASRASKGLGVVVIQASRTLRRPAHARGRRPAHPRPPLHRRSRIAPAACRRFPASTPFRISPTRRSSSSIPAPAHLIVIGGGADRA